MTSSLPSSTSPFQGPSLSRRGFVELSAAGLVASWLLPSRAAAFERRSALAATRSTAKNCIFVWMPGAPSQVDTWDWKESSYVGRPVAEETTLKPTSFGGGLTFPQGLLPGIATHLGDVAIVRSVLASALVHGLAQTWSQIARNPTGATGAIAPHVGAVAALELERSRRPEDVLPGFMALNTPSGIPGSGYLPALYSPFSIQPPASAGVGLTSLAHPASAGGSARFALRWKDLNEVDAALRTGAPLGKEGSDAAGFYGQAKAMMDSPEVNELFTYTADEATRYGSTPFGNACNIARKVLAGRKGTRFIQLTLGGWDHHSNIYSPQGNGLYTQCGQLDPAIAALLTDLKATKGEGGGTLLDETLVVLTGEFGRTPTYNGQGGRDHFYRTSSVFAGGGVKGGQVIGATDASGSNLVSSGWAEGREVRMEDLAATIYTALGIDWTTERHDDPLGRGFEYVPYAKDGVFKPIDPLFG